MAEKIVKDSQGLAKDLANDCISRYGVSAWLANMGYSKLADVLMDKNRFPSAQPKSYREGYQAGFKDAQPERKRGKWIDYANSHCECSVCHTEWSYFQNEVECFEFCPNCGADMREDDHETN